MAKQTTDLDESRVVDLREKAKDAGLTGVSHMRKEELIEALGSQRSPRGDTARGKADADADTGTDANAIEILTEDHEKSKRCSEAALDDEPEEAQLAQLTQQICAELTLHTEIEEQIFYPALKERAASDESTEVTDEVLEAYVEHGSVKELIAQIESLQPSDESYKAILTVIREQVEHHVQEEESEMFKAAQKLLGTERLNELGEQLMAYKENAATSKA